MLKKWTRDMSVELHWMKRDLVRRWRLDTPTGIMGILILISGFFLFMVIGGGVAHIFRSFVPLVSGSRVGEVYWQSVSFGIKTSFIFVIFSGSIIMYFLLKLSNRR
ncbi:hypothetical protein [Desulfosporosinus sp. Sb-LF]|uniref:hypothetical protein n=1 Tax=Desulfosporosinus sp. Sb-LF TaxID=2560027 RepID=UPI00107F4045|nr:hypothetical protein [Desulfosporosinus sp. Sb-LF]TGE31039.1 hypothetical protein E4K68_19245 [Desulfosporosinus sp. Sb-LF]